MERAIGLISDYGLKDHYVGTVHAVIKGVNPEATVVDITHNVRPFDVVDAALKLKWSFKYFPAGSVFLILVDPDPAADPIIVATESYFLVCPNNGVGSFMFEEQPPEVAYRITADHYFLNVGTGNFRGRDQLAPIAAELLRLQSPMHLGEKMELSEVKRFKLPSPVKHPEGFYETFVLDVDHFGNLILNFPYSGEAPSAVEISGMRVGKFSEDFKGLKQGELFISVNPESYLQVVAYMSSASKLLKAGRGAKVKVYF